MAIMLSLSTWIKIHELKHIFGSPKRRKMYQTNKNSKIKVEIYLNKALNFFPFFHFFFVKTLSIFFPTKKLEENILPHLQGRMIRPRRISSSLAKIPSFFHPFFPFFFNFLFLMLSLLVRLEIINIVHLVIFSYKPLYYQAHDEVDQLM